MGRKADEDDLVAIANRWLAAMPELDWALDEPGSLTSGALLIRLKYCAETIRFNPDHVPAEVLEEAIDFNRRKGRTELSESDIREQAARRFTVQLNDAEREAVLAEIERRKNTQGAKASASAVLREWAFVGGGPHLGGG